MLRKLLVGCCVVATILLGRTLPASAAIANLGHTAVNLGQDGGTANNGGSGYDTTGASLIVIVVSPFHFGTLPVTVSDSYSNTYSLAKGQSADASTGFSDSSLYYVVPDGSHRGTGHTFTITGSFTYDGVVIAWWSGTATTSPVDGTPTGAAATASATIQPGSQTPSEDNCLLVTGASTSNYDTATVGGTFTVLDHVDTAVGADGAWMATEIQTSATLRNPTWTFSSAANGPVATMAIFKSAPAVSTASRLPLLGVGK